MSMRKMSLVIGILFASLVLSGAAPRTDVMSSDERAIRAMYDRFSAAVQAKDLKTIMSIYSPDERIVVFDAFLPRQYVGAAALTKDYQDFFAAFPGPAKSEISDIHVSVAGTMAFAYGVDRWVVTGQDGKPVEMVFRFTNVLRKVNGKWLIVHEHVSFPVDAETGKADFLSKL
jgi:uncharacterized protein (TIGR02246 family)